MKRRLTIKSRITLWYAALLVAICTAALWLLFAAAQRAVERYCEDTLISASVVLKDELEVEHGILEIDDDLDDFPNVYASLFDEQGTLIYGRQWVNAAFAQDRVQQAVGSGHSWYLYDVRISVPGWENTWLRLYMSADELTGLREAVLHYGLLLLPLLAAVALAGGYLLTARAFRPVRRMNDVAASIVHGEDLSARIEDAADGDELQRLGATINGMLERLENAFRREQQFTSDAAHELRTPLNRIMTQGEYALSRENPEEKNEAIAHMLHTAEDMNDMVRQLLMLARLEAGRLLKRENCALDELLTELVQDLTPVAQERGMQIHARLTPCSLSCDRSMLLRAVINLLDNAIRYGRENGSIVIELTVQEETACICVRDDGCGIAPEDLPHVFTRFWRGDSARNSQGTGIGLSLAASIAKAHGGSIAVRSVPGEGSAFTISLPVKKEC